ncbi:MAG: glutathione-regulated potassium-efflux system oxidoreductase KefF [Deltaproteobacteria bacterium]|nr:glutathione-regulated potassium-efflux system oxidoreductase KefF [Deltaproteobacteria bacterium]
MVRSGRAPGRGCASIPEVIALVYAHPYPDRSRANRLLLESVRDLPGLEVRSLYDRYPDFAIDVAAEQAWLAGAHTLVWQHPIYWYSVPGLMKHWIDKVLVHGWAYGEGGTALRGKRALWVCTTGGDPAAYGPDGMHAHPFEVYEPPIRQTARFCGMEWLDPVVVHGAHRVPESELYACAARYRARLEGLAR